MWHTDTVFDGKENAIYNHFLFIQHGRQFKVIDPVLPYKERVPQKKGEALKSLPLATKCVLFAEIYQKLF